MIRCMSRLLTAFAFLLASIPCAFAETLTISWDPVTTFTDGSAIGAGNSVTYTAYWTTDPGLGSLHTIASSLAVNYATFDPGTQGMTRGGTVYFTAKAVLSTGEASALSPAYGWVVPTVTPPSAALSSIAVSGPSSVNEGGSGTYTATGTWSDGTTAPISPTWSENSSYASISTGGVLTASTVTSGKTVTVTASYTSGGVTKTATKNVTIVDVPAAAPAAPQNFGITGPISSGATEVWRLAWDPVTAYANGAPLEAGRAIRFTPYWTDDPALSEASLREIGSLISGTTLDFSPSANQMAKNRVVYLTVRATLDTGGQSSLSPSLAWRVENDGPVPPGRGKIYKKQ